MAGAAQWPVLALLGIGDLAVLTQLPPSGTHVGLGDAFVIAGFLNLLVVAVAGPVAGLLLRRRRPDLPAIIARDRAGATLLAVLFATLLTAGQTYQAESDAVRGYVASQGAPRYRRAIDRATTLDLGAGLYRTCVAPDGPGADLCLLVDTTESPPGIRVDPSTTPNAVLVGPGGP
jgi:hypothetical protein